MAWSDSTTTDGQLGEPEILQQCPRPSPVSLFDASSIDIRRSKQRGPVALLELFLPGRGARHLLDQGETRLARSPAMPASEHAARNRQHRVDDPAPSASVCLFRAGASTTRSGEAAELPGLICSENWL